MTKVCAAPIQSRPQFGEKTASLSRSQVLHLLGYLTWRHAAPTVSAKPCQYLLVPGDKYMWPERELARTTTTATAFLHMMRPVGHKLGTFAVRAHITWLQFIRA